MAVSVMIFGLGHGRDRPQRPTKRAVDGIEVREELHEHREHNYSGDIHPQQRNVCRIPPKVSQELKNQQTTARKTAISHRGKCAAG